VRPPISETFRESLARLPSGKTKWSTSSIRWTVTCGRLIWPRRNNWGT